MTAINSGPVGEVGGVRLPLQSLHGYGSVFMYSASTSPGGGNGQSGGGGGEVTLRLREPEDIPEEVLARLEDTATLSISLQGDAVLRLGSASTGNSNLELFDSESGPDLTLSPQTFTSTAEAFINDNSDSLGVPGDNDMGSSEESRTGPGDPGKLGVKKSRPKASSPNRQGPQQCQVPISAHYRVIRIDLVEAETQSPLVQFFSSPFIHFFFQCQMSASIQCVL
uniref:Uncharacterized protein n=1 Tax=Fopius arisanus TaxID=64838 RepID=A0A0C9RHN2_9HYME